MTLYDIDTRIQETIENGYYIDEDTGEFIEGEDALEQLSIDRNKKLENIALYIKNTKAEADAIKVEEKKLKDRREIKEKRVESLKNYLSKSLLNNGETGFETPTCKLSFRTSKAVELADEKAFLEDATNSDYFICTAKVNKTLLKTLLDRGEKIEGASIVEKKNIQIK